MAHLAERSLPKPEIRGSNLDLTKFYKEHLLNEKTKIKKNRLGMGMQVSLSDRSTIRLFDLQK